MAIHKYMRAVLRVLSYSAPSVSKHYLLVRQTKKITQRPLPPTYHTIALSVACDGRSVPCLLFTPHGKIESLPVILFAHGGGWVTGDVNTYSRLCQTLAETLGHMVLSVDYRLAPEHPFPAGLDDFYAVACALFAGKLLAVASTDITIMGDSAGGNLTAALCLRARDEGTFMPYRQILFYPACANAHTPTASGYPSLRENGQDFLLTCTRINEYMDLYCANPADRHNPYFAPLVSRDYSRQPRTLIITAQYDPLRDEGEEYGARLSAAGNYVTVHRIPDALHGFLSLPLSFPHVQHALQHIHDFLNATEVKPHEIYKKMENA